MFKFNNIEKHSGENSLKETSDPFSINRLKDP